MRTTLRLSLFLQMALTGLIFSNSAFANLPSPAARLAEAIEADKLRSIDDYRVGDEWGKKPISTEDMTKIPALDRAAHATARVGGATGFVLGKFGNDWVIATNYHVCSEAWDCEGYRVTFSLGNFRVPIKKFLRSYTAIDLALLTLEVEPGSKEEEYLQKYAQNFAFNESFTAGEELVTVGYGSAGNPSQTLVGNWDYDCKIFSQSGDMRFMNDPDAINPGQYTVWSIATGCDVSHGDSGSAMVNRQTGAVKGIIWTGKFPKIENIQSSNYLDQLLKTNSEEVWTELNYMVPAQQILSILKDSVQKDGLDPEVRAVIELIIQ